MSRTRTDIAWRISIRPSKWVSSRRRTGSHSHARPIIGSLATVKRTRSSAGSATGALIGTALPRRRRRRGGQTSSRRRPRRGCRRSSRTRSPARRRVRHFPVSLLQCFTLHSSLSSSLFVPPSDQFRDFPRGFPRLALVGVPGAGDDDEAVAGGVREVRGKVAEEGDRLAAGEDVERADEKAPGTRMRETWEKSPSGSGGTLSSTSEKSQSPAVSAMHGIQPKRSNGRRSPPRPAPAEDQARICCTNVAFARPRFVVDSSPVRAQRAKRPLCPTAAPAPFAIPDERAASPRASFRTNSPSPKSRRSEGNEPVYSFPHPLLAALTPRAKPFRATLPRKQHSPFSPFLPTELLIQYATSARLPATHPNPRKNSATR